MLNPLEYQFKNSLDRYGYDVLVNHSEPIRVLFKEYNELNNIKEYKFMLFENGLAKQGDIITLFDDDWLVQHEDISVNDVYTKVVIRRLKFGIKFNFAGEVISIPTAIDEGTYRLENGQYLTLPEGRIVLHMQENETTKRIAKDQRFIIMSNAWKVIQKTNPEYGLYKIYADVEIFSTDDDKENEIADRWKYESKDNYIVTINNVVESPLNIGDTLQLDVTVTNNGEVVSVPLTYTSSNESVLTVDANGLVNCVGVGSAIITVLVTSKPDAKGTITLSVEEEQVIDNFTIEIAGELEIRLGDSQTYIATVKNNGVIVKSKAVTWSVDDTTRATITGTTDNTCTLKASEKFDAMGEVVLTAKLVDDEAIFAKYYIEVIGLW